MIYLYIAVIILVCLGIVLFFVFYNKKQNEIKQKLKEAGEFGAAFIGNEKKQEKEKQTENTNDKPIEKSENGLMQQSEKKEEVDSKSPSLDDGVFEDFSIEDESEQEPEKNDKSNEDENPFFKKKFFYDEKDYDDDLANDSLDEFPELEKYKQMLREERDKISFDDNEFFNRASYRPADADDEFKKILLDDTRFDEDDE